MRMPGLTIIAAILAAALVLVFRGGTAGDHDAAAAQDEPPPIATCTPPMTPHPPGLYPILTLRRAEFTFTEFDGVCVGDGWRRAVEVCISNGGPGGYYSEFKVRIQGCLEKRVDVVFPELDSATADCRMALAEPRLDSDEPCEILIDAELEICGHGVSGHHQFIRLPVPEPPPMCAPVPSPTVAVTATSEPSPTIPVGPPAIHLPIALANAEPDTSAEGYVPIVLQVATFGGLMRPPEVGFVEEPVARAPLLTIYADGTTIRATGRDLTEWREGKLSEAALESVMNRLIEEAEVFQYPSNDDFARCVTDGTTTRLYVSTDGREHRIASYLMLWLGQNPERCPPGSPGMPDDPKTEHFFRLATTIVDVMETVGSEAGETAYTPEHSTVYAVELPLIDPPEPPPTWPLSMPIADAVGYDTLSPEDVLLVLGAIRTHREYEHDRFAMFDDAVSLYNVAARVEVPGWDTYVAPR